MTQEYKTQTNPDNTTRSADWDRLQAELKLWGRKLDELGQQSERVGEGIVNDLQARYQDLVKEAEALQSKTDAEINEARRELEKVQAEAEEQSASMVAMAKENVKKSANTAMDKSKDIRERTSEATSKMAGSAQQLGTGFSRAWQELNKGFQRAYERLN